MKYTPVLVAAGVGLVDGKLNDIAAISKHKYAHGMFKFGVLAAGVAGELFFDWNKNVDYGMMTAASAMIGARVPQAFADKSIKSIATYSAPAVAAARPMHAAACTSCAKPLARPLTTYYSGAA